MVHLEWEAGDALEAGGEWIWVDGESPAEVVVGIDDERVWDRWQDGSAKRLCLLLGEDVGGGVGGG